MIYQIFWENKNYLAFYSLLGAQLRLVLFFFFLCWAFIAAQGFLELQRTSFSCWVLLSWNVGSRGQGR